MTSDEQPALDRLPCGWLRMNAQGILLAVNPALCRMLGVDASSLAGKSLDSLLTRPSRVLYQSYLQPLLRLHGRVEEFALVFDLGQGQTLDALVYSGLGPNSPATPQPAASIELVLASMRKRRGIEDEMLRIKRAADHAPGMIFQLMQLADGTCHFPYTSEAIRRMYGVTSQQASESAVRLFGFLNGDTRTGLCRGLHEAALAEEDWHAVFEVTLPGPTVRWHEAQATPRRLANGVTLWHGHCADVTDKRALETAVADRIAVQKMHQTRSDFLARVSHELRTPLNGILGFAQMMATDKADNLSTQQRERLAVLLASGHHLLELVNEVLEVSSLEAGQLHIELEDLALLPQLERALQAVEGRARGAQVVVLPLHCPQGLRVLSNGQRLQQVLANLLSNAVKYNRPEGKVQLVARKAANGVQLDVIDTGQGMSAEQCASLFQAFNRLGAEKTAVEGHGLGLVITKHLLSCMGAGVAVSSERGFGSTFSVLMPAAKGQALAPIEQPEALDGPVEAPPPPPPPDPVPSTRPTEHVLYVEDDEVNAILMSAVLGMRPWAALQVAAQGKQALELAGRQRFDLLLIDMHLPDTSGLELLPRLRQVAGLESVPAIMVSAGARQQDIEQALACGFAGYWTKPLNVDATLLELDELLPTSTAGTGRPPRTAHR